MYIDHVYSGLQLVSDRVLSDGYVPIDQFCHVRSQVPHSFVHLPLCQFEIYKWLYISQEEVYLNRRCKNANIILR